MCSVERPCTSASRLCMRRAQVCFATCFDPRVLSDLQAKHGSAVSIKVVDSSSSLQIQDIAASDIDGPGGTQPPVLTSPFQTLPSPGRSLQGALQ